MNVQPKSNWSIKQFEGFRILVNSAKHLSRTFQLCSFVLIVMYYVIFWFVSFYRYCKLLSVPLYLGMRSVRD